VPDNSIETDVILSGGGVLCVALVGAIDELARGGHTFVRIAGNSGGAIVGSLVATLEASGAGVAGNIVDIVYRMPFETFNAAGTHRMLKPFSEAHSLVRHGGLHDGSTLRNWLGRTLAEFGVRTFGDLRLPEQSLGHRLVVTSSDVSTSTPAHFPWDYPHYGRDPDAELVADAVRMSVSVPYYFTPVKLIDRDGRTRTLVDGFLFTNYPADVFDPPDRTRPPRQIVGVNLSGILPHDDRRVHKVRGPLSLGHCIVTSLLGACDSTYIDDPQHTARTISIPVMDCQVHLLDFKLTTADKRRLIDCGRRAAARFLESWDFGKYCDEYYPPVSLGAALAPA
jgi:NTE family protein